MTAQLETLPAPMRTALVALVGIPYAPKGRTHRALDCWGLCLIAARELYGLELPEYFYSADELLADAAVLIERECHGPRWHYVPGPYPHGTVHIFRLAGAKVHCGLHLTGPAFLHTLPGRFSCIESLDDVDWRQRRIGSYRYAP